VQGNFSQQLLNLAATPAYGTLWRTGAKEAHKIFDEAFITIK
jgi:hypothetical protein